MLPKTAIYRTGLYLCVALSGFSALIYELLWTKQLSLVFGTNMAAVSTVASAFMAGLALGSFLFGRIADRSSNLPRLYAGLEFAILICALGFIPTLHLVETVYVFLCQTFPDAPATTTSLRCLLAGLILLPSTTCMGGTLPIICRYFADDDISVAAGRFYAINTFGAVTGWLSAGFLLIPTLGLSDTGWLAMAISLVIAGCFFQASRRIKRQRTTSIAAPTAAPPLPPKQRALLLGTVAVLGALALGYEMLWTRTFILFMGTTSFAFSGILGIYLTGLALGGTLYARRLHRVPNRKQLLFWLTALLSITMLAAVPLYDQLPYLFQYAHELAHGSWVLLSLASLCILALVILPPAIFSGACIPTAVGLLAPTRAHTAQGIGTILLNNTLGAMIGGLTAGFLLVPQFGLQGSFRLLAAINLLLAFVLAAWLWQRKRNSWPVPAALLAGALLTFIPYPWNQILLNSGVYYYAPMISQVGGLDEYLSGNTLVAVEEGKDATVAVMDFEQRIRYFKVNGKTDGSIGSDMSTQVLVGQLPMLLHPEPKNTLVIGLGTGVTVQAAASHPQTRIDCVEISEEVVKAAEQFTAVNGDVLKRPEVHLAIQDARHWLLTRSDRYDVIISEPSNPWQTGNANLFTADFYAMAASHLNSDGLFCQWLPLYDLPMDKIQVAVRTFLHTFPDATAFLNNTDFILLGSKTPQAFDVKRMRQTMAHPEIRASLAPYGLATPFTLLARTYFADSSFLQALSTGAPLNSDDHPILEYTPQLGYSTTLFPENFSSLMQVRSYAGPQVPPLEQPMIPKTEISRMLREMARELYRAGHGPEADVLLQKASHLQPNHS